MDQLIQPDWLEANLEASDLRVLDCTVVFERADGVLTIESGQERWSRGHLPGSAHLDLLTDLADQTTELRFMMPPAEQFTSVMESVGVGEGTRVVLYDSDKNKWATRAWWMLRTLGFDEAGVLDGGLRRWKAEGRFVTTDPTPDHPAAAFATYPRPGVFVDKHAVLAAIDDDAVVIVNALTPAQHNGETKDYARRGHIPTSVNVPAVSLVEDGNYAYAGADELRRRVAPALESGAQRTIAYCGVGISATSTAFALSMLGVDEIAIYDASLDEWARDPSLPLTLPFAE